MSVVASFKKQKTGKLGPRVACFADGAPPVARLEGDGDISFTYMQREGGRKKSQRVLVAEGGSTRYEARNFGADGTGNETCAYAVGIYSRAAKELRVVGAGNLFALRLRTEGYDGTKVGADTMAGLSNWERRKVLTEDFGSKKRKREQRARDANVVSEHGVAGAAAVSRLLERNTRAAAAGAKVNPLEASLMANRRTLLPPFNLEATSVDDVYDIDSVVRAGDLAALKPNAKVLESLAKKPSQLEAAHSASPFPSYVYQRIQLLRSEKDKPARHRTAGLLAFLVALLKLFRSGRFLKHTAETLGESLEVPEEVAAHLLALFTEEEGKSKYKRSPQLQDKLLLHILVLVLHIEDFSLDITRIASDLNLTLDKACMYFRETGCTYTLDKKKGRKTALARLKLPLTFPVKKKRGGGRK